MNIVTLKAFNFSFPTINNNNRLDVRTFEVEERNLHLLQGLN